MFEFGAQAVDLFLHFASGIDGFLLLHPLRFEGRGAFFEIGDLFVEFDEAGFGSGVLFLLQSLAFHLALHDLTFEDVDFGGHGVEFDLDAAGGFVHKVDGLVRQEAVGDVAIAQGGGGDDGTVLNAHAVMDFVALLQTAQDGDGVFNAWFADFHGLEATLQRWVFFDVFAVFVEGSCANAAQFTTGELRLEEIARIHGTFAFASADDGVEFVDEEDDLALAGSNFFEEGFEALLEFATELGPGHHAAEVHADELFALEGIGHVTRDDAACEAFGDGGLAHAGLADEHGIVLGAAAEHLHDAADFFIAADDGIDLALLGTGGEVGAVFFERLVFAFGVLINDALAATHGGEGFGNGVVGETGLLQRIGQLGLGFEEGEDDVLDAEVFIFELFLLVLSLRHELAHFIGKMQAAGAAADLGLAGEEGFDAGFQALRRRRGHRCFFKQGSGDAALLLEQGEDEVSGLQFLMLMPGGDGLGGIEGLLELNGEFFGGHGWWEKGLFL